MTAFPASVLLPVSLSFPKMNENSTLWVGVAAKSQPVCVVKYDIIALPKWRKVKFAPPKNSRVPNRQKWLLSCQCIPVNGQGAGKETLR